MSDTILLESLSVLTLNVWAKPIISRHKEARIEAISSVLCTGVYDIVALQEVWSQTDTEFIKEQTKCVLPYAHYFFNGPLGAGLLVLSKYPIIGALFHACPVNGYLHRIQHFDWFGGKGVGLCKIQIGNYIVHLYNVHLDAAYELSNEEHKTQRALQTFDVAQFIEETRDGSVLQILAGDMNAKRMDISHRIFVHVSKMVYCYNGAALVKRRCRHNSYINRATLAQLPLGIYIGQIFIRSANYIQTTVLDYNLPLPDRVPGQLFSFSQQDAVAVKLKIVYSQKYAHNTLTCNGFLTSDTEPVNTAPILPQTLCTNASCQVAILKRVQVLKESIALCESSLVHLLTDRIFYFFAAFIIAVLIINISEFLASFTTIVFFLNSVFFGVFMLCILMGSIWLEMERSAIFSGKAAMEKMLRFNIDILNKT